MNYTRGLHVLVALAMVCVLDVTAFAQESKVEKAWKAIGENKLLVAEEAFKVALKENPNDIRALVGISFLYEHLEQFENSWKYSEQLLGASPEAAQYFLCISSNERLYSNVAKKNPATVAFVEKLAKTSVSETDKDALAKSIAHSVANERIGSYYEGRGEVDKAREFYAQIESVDSWLLMGPFDNVSGSGFDKEYEPETEFKKHATYSGYAESSVQWQSIPAGRFDKWVDFTLYYPNISGVFYANSFVHSDKAQRVLVRLGTSGAVKLFVNNSIVVANDEEWNNDVDTYMAEIDLQQGWNRILVKVGSWDINRCNFLLRFTKQNGSAVAGLRYSTEEQEYKQKAAVQAKSIALPTESFFEKQIATNPTHIENYILLSEAYLHNDKAEQAEITLRKALAYFPNSLLLREKLVNALSRGEKSDEVLTELEEFLTIDENNIESLRFRFSRALRNEELDTCDKILDVMKSVLPDRKEIQRNVLQLLTQRKDPSLLDFMEQRYNEDPYDENWFSYKFGLVARKERDKKKLTEMLIDYSKRNYSGRLQEALAGMYLEDGDFESWLNVYKDLIRKSPAAPGYYYTIAREYYNRREYDKAIENINKSIEFCPQCNGYYRMLGNIYNDTKQTDKALALFKKSLSLSPYQTDLRKQIREMEGKKPVFSHFSTYNVDSLVKAFSSSKEKSSESAIVVLEDSKTVLFPEGTNEHQFEYVIKVFNQDGIDSYKELSLPIDTSYADYSIEKAVSIKPNGKEIRADASGTDLVFKSLEPGDLIHVKYKYQSLRGGRFLKHFTDRFVFASTKPIKHSRYAVIIPKGISFQARTIRTNPETETETEDGTLYEWKLKDIAPIKTEVGMPPLSSVGSFVEISTIRDWSFLSNWYKELAERKTRSTFEIRDKAKELFSDVKPGDEQAIMQRVYEFITENIRYSSVPFRQSGLIPQSARDVLVTKIGDCKDVATLAIALFREANIEAKFVLVNTEDYYNLDRLPSFDFDHCIVAVKTKNGRQFLDFTAADYPVGTVPYGDLWSAALVIGDFGMHKLTDLHSKLFMPSTMTFVTSLNVKADESIDVSRKATLTGALSANFRSLKHDSEEEQTKQMKEFMSNDFPDMNFKSVRFENLNNIQPTFSYTIDLSLSNYLKSVGNMKFMEIPWTEKFKAMESLSYDERTYPIEYFRGIDTLTDVVQIALPKGLQAIELPPPFIKKTEIADYEISITAKENTVLAKRKYTIKKNLIEPSEYKAFKEMFNQILKEESKQLLIGTAPAGSGGKKKK